MGKDPDTPRSERSPGSSHALNSILSANCKSSLEKAPILEVKRKTLSLKRPKVSFTQAIDSNIPVIYSANCAKLIIYGIDTGRYYLVKSSSMFKLVDKFVAMKPFAILCKLLLSSEPDETASVHFLPDR